MYNGPLELIYINGSRRNKVLVASIMEIQVILYVKARGV